jgi:hypothetical protein
LGEEVVIVERRKSGGMSEIFGGVLRAMRGRKT